MQLRSKVLLGAGLAAAPFLAAGAAGAGIEHRTDAVAEGKIETAEFCLGVVYPRDIYGESRLSNCLWHGSQDGEPVRNNQLRHFAELDDVREYISDQQGEAEAIEIHRVLLWSVGMPGAAAATAATIAILGIAGWAAVNA